jgi:hypothetical protein
MIRRLYCHKILLTCTCKWYLFTRSGMFALDVPKMQRAKLQRVIQLTRPLQMASVQNLGLFRQTTFRKVPGSQG